MLRRCIVVGSLIMGMSGCFGSTAGTGPTPSEPLVGSTAEVDAQLGHRVRVVGEAKNTAQGATVVDDRLVVVVQEFRAWPRPIEGKTVEAVGVIARDERARGPVSEGEHLFLREVSYLLME